MRLKHAYNKTREYTGTAGRLRKETLCWDCRRAMGPDACSWAARFQPVEGWKATPTKVDAERSYLVRDCPLLLPDHPYIFRVCAECARCIGNAGGRRYCARWKRRIRIYAPGVHVACKYFVDQKLDEVDG